MEIVMLLFHLFPTLFRLKSAPWRIPIGAKMCFLVVVKCCKTAVKLLGVIQFEQIQMTFVLTE